VAKEKHPHHIVSINLTRILNLSRKWVAGFTQGQLYTLGLEGSNQLNNLMRTSHILSAGFEEENDITICYELSLI
jgi:hypothetical protein